MPRGPGRLQVVGWLGAFLVFPAGAWLAASLSRGFGGKSLSNVTLEPFAVMSVSLVVFLAWYLTARQRLRPMVGAVLLLLLSAGALAVQRLAPVLAD